MNGVTKNDQKEIFYPMDDFRFGKKWKNLQFLITKNVFRICENRDISIDFLLF